MTLAKHFKELRVYKQGFAAASRIYKLSKHWPKEERYSLTDQIRRSSRSVCANIAEAWRKRRYPAHFVSKLSGQMAKTLIPCALASTARFSHRRMAAHLATA